MSTAVLVDTDQLDRQIVGEISAACARVGAGLVPVRDASVAGGPAALIVGALRRGERRLSAALVELMTELAPDAAVLLFSDEPLIRPIVATHKGRVTLLARPATSARIRGTVRMLLANRCARGAEHLDAHVWTAIVGPDTSTMVPALRRDEISFTAVVPLEAGWSGAQELCEEADLIAQARIDEDERLRRLREILGNAAGMIHLGASSRQWLAYWPTTRCPLLMCSTMRLPRVCNIAEAASKNVLALAASPGDLVIGMGRNFSEWTATAELHFADGGAAFVEHVELHDRISETGLVVEVR